MREASGLNRKFRLNRPCGKIAPSAGQKAKHQWRFYAHRDN
jgi:hypothetical protein